MLRRPPQAPGVLISGGHLHPVFRGEVSAWEMGDVEGQLLAGLNEHQTIANSAGYAASRQLEHSQIVGIIKSLQASGLVEAEVRMQGSMLPLVYTLLGRCPHID